MESSDVVIGGGGIIGLSAALQLAQNGFRVKVIERGRAMSESSWAAAGMLAAEDPENPPELAELSALSRNLYPDYLNALVRLSGRAIPLRTGNTLQATRPNSKFHCRATDTRLPITPDEAMRRIPKLETGSRSLLWLEESSLDPRDLCLALPAAAQEAGVLLEEQTEVLAFASGRRSVSITTSRGQLSAAAFVNCCGAWAALIQQAVQPPECVAQEENFGRFREFSVVPKKGQMVTVLMPGPAQLRHVVRTPEIYLVPRGDGRIVIGATVESAGFDRQVEVEAVDWLITKAAELWPPIRLASVVDKWAGLRPATGDNLPLIGSAGLPNCWLATGHFRNGILLAPATGLVVRQLLEGRQPDTSLAAFALERFPVVGSAAPLP